MITSIMSKLKTFIGDKLIKLFWKNNCRLTPMYNERICDYPFILNKLRIKNQCKVLDCGCSNDFMVPFLCSLGLDVYGIDKREGVDFNFVRQYPTFHFVKGDLRSIPFQEKYFDISICISTLEHIFDKSCRVPEDWKALNEIIRVTKPNGQILISAVFGAGKVNNVYPKFPHRIYDSEGLDSLFSNPFYKNKINLLEVYFFKKFGVIWQPTTRKNAEEMDGLFKAQALVFVNLLRV